MIGETRPEFVVGNCDGVPVNFLEVSPQAYVRNAGVVPTAVVRGEVEAQVRHTVETSRPGGTICQNINFQYPQKNYVK